MNPKEIGRSAGRIFLGELPASWAARSQEDQEDYGIDYEVELISPEDKATGFIFKIQQKGTEKATRLADGRTVTFSMETEKVAYYLRKLRLPTVLVVVEISSKKCFWVPLHGNHDIAQRLSQAEKKSAASLTIHIPAENLLPDTASQLLTEVTHMMTFLVFERLKEVQLPDAAAVFAREPDLEKAERNLKLTQSALRSERTQRLINDGKLDEALKINHRAFVDDTDTLEGRFHAGVQAVRVAGGIAVMHPDQINGTELLKLRITIYHRLAALTRSLPSSNFLRHYSLFLARISRLRAYVDHDAGLLLANQAQLPGLEDFARVMILDASRKSKERVVAELRRLQRRIVAMLALSMFSGVVYAWMELTETLGPFLMSLRHSDSGPAVAAIRAWLDSVGVVCLHYAEIAGDKDIIALSALNHVRIGLDTGEVGGRVDDARRLITQIADDARREQTLEFLDRLIALSAQKSAPDPEEPPEEELEPLIRKMALAVGIDIDDPRSPYADAIRVGIKDYNPGRVLRDCEQLFINIESVGIPGQMLGLQTAGVKCIRCLKHGHRTGGFELDQFYSFFKAQHCDKCPDRTPRPPDWKWSHNWQRTQDERVLWKEHGDPDGGEEDATE